MTIDEELSKLEDNIRRLKIEYEAYFNGGLPRPPRDAIFRVETAIKRFSSDQSELNFGQRFRFNQLAQKYAVYNDLWRKRLRDLEEGRGRREPASGFQDIPQVLPQDTAQVLPRDLAQVLSQDVAQVLSQDVAKVLPQDIASVQASDPEAETRKVHQLFEDWAAAKRQVGEAVPDVGIGVFSEFVRDKTAEIKQKLGCEKVEFRVKVEDGHVKLRAGRG